MNRKLLYPFSFLVTLLLVVAPLFGSARRAVSGQLGGTSLPQDQASRPLVVIDCEEDYLTGLQPQAASLLPSVIPDELGEAGFSLRYDGTLGLPAQAYVEDIQHLNFPYGVGVAGEGLWIADSFGSRALLFSRDGSFMQQIGQAGFPYSVEGTDLEWIADVAVDQLGQVWLVDRGANHVARFDPSGVFQGDLGQPWIAGSGSDQFSAPEGIAFDSRGYIYVSDGNNHRVQIFDPSGSWLNTIGVSNMPGSSHLYFNQPRHISLDASDRLYVADGGNHRVQVFDVSQPLSVTHLATLGISGLPGAGNAQLNNPAGVAVDASRIYVADQGNGRVQIFDRQTFAYVDTLPGPDTAGTLPFDPSDVAVNSLGQLFVVDHANAQVLAYSADLRFLRSYGVTGVPYQTDSAHLNRPAGVTLSADGGVILAESYGQRLLKLDASGNLVWQVGEAGKWGSDNAHFNRPSDVAVGPGGEVYVVDRNNHRVQVFSAQGVYRATLGGTPGTSEMSFFYPRGVAVDAAGRVYVADTGNHRLQVFDSELKYLVTLGQDGLPGSAHDQLNEPFDVAVGADGKVYVADHSNHRVQVFDAELTHLLTIGVTGVPGQDFVHLDDPTAVEVDAQGRIYVADNWGGRLQVFDSRGFYLTTLGNSWGSRSGDLRQAQGLALDRQGVLYIADSLNHRLQRFLPGVPNWKQSNSNGFGDPLNWWASALLLFDGSLYAGVHNLGGTGAQLWQLTPDEGWTQVVSDGFGQPLNSGISSLVEFDGSLFAGTENISGTQVWSSADGSSWQPVVTDGFGSQPANLRTTAMAVHAGQLYAAAGNWLEAPSSGAQLWRTADGSTWTEVTGSGFGDAHNSVVLTLEAVGGYFYAGTRNELTGGELWRSTSGDPGSWSQVNLDGFGSPANTAVTSLVSFNGLLLAGTRNWQSGAELWSSTDGLAWTKVMSAGFGGGAASGWVDSLTAYKYLLVAVLRNYNEGAHVLVSLDGLRWQPINTPGWGDNNNAHSGDGETAIAVFADRLFIGSGNIASGGEVWSTVRLSCFLPAVHK